MKDRRFFGKFRKLVGVIYSEAFFCSTQVLRRLGMARCRLYRFLQLLLACNYYIQTYIYRRTKISSTYLIQEDTPLWVYQNCLKSSPYRVHQKYRDCVCLSWSSACCPFLSLFAKRRRIIRTASVPSKRRTISSKLIPESYIWEQTETFVTVYELEIA